MTKSSFYHIHPIIRPACSIIPQDWSRVHKRNYVKLTTSRQCIVCPSPLVLQAIPYLLFYVSSAGDFTPGLLTGWTLFRVLHMSLLISSEWFWILYVMRWLSYFLTCCCAGNWIAVAIVICCASQHLPEINTTLSSCATFSWLILHIVMGKLHQPDIQWRNTWCNNLLQQIRNHFKPH